MNGPSDGWKMKTASANEGLGHHPIRRDKAQLKRFKWRRLLCVEVGGTQVFLMREPNLSSMCWLPIDCGNQCQQGDIFHFDESLFTYSTEAKRKKQQSTQPIITDKAVDGPRGNRPRRRRCTKSLCDGGEMVEMENRGATGALYCVASGIRIGFLTCGPWLSTEYQGYNISRQSVCSMMHYTHFLKFAMLQMCKCPAFT